MGPISKLRVECQIPDAKESILFKTMLRWRSMEIFVYQNEVRVRTFAIPFLPPNNCETAELYRHSQGSDWVKLGSTLRDFTWSCRMSDEVKIGLYGSIQLLVLPPRRRASAPAQALWDSLKLRNIIGNFPSSYRLRNPDTSWTVRTAVPSIPITNLGLLEILQELAQDSQ